MKIPTIELCGVSRLVRDAQQSTCRRPKLQHSHFPQTQLMPSDWHQQQDNATQKSAVNT